MEIHKKSRMELRCAERTGENENKVCRMYKKSRMEARFAKMTVEVRKRWVKCIKIAELSSEAH